MSVTLHLLTAGACRHPERVVRRGGRWRAVEFPALVGVIRHPARGVILYDTGYSPGRFRADTARWPYSLYRRMTPLRCTPEETAAAQLARSGVDPGDVSLVIVSHFHADHVGGLRDFPAARVLYLRGALDPGWRTRSATANLRAGFLPGHLPGDLAERTEYADDRPRVARSDLGPDLTGGYDLLGDGTLIGVDLSGHTPGQLGLLLPRTPGPPVLLAGDACWNRRAYTHLELPHPVVRLVTADPPGYRRTIAALGRLATARPDLLILPSHCTTSLALARTALAGHP